MAINVIHFQRGQPEKGSQDMHIGCRYIPSDGSEPKQGKNMLTPPVPGGFPDFPFPSGSDVTLTYQPPKASLQLVFHLWVDQAKAIVITFDLSEDGSLKGPNKRGAAADQVVIQQESDSWAVMVPADLV